MSGTVKHNTSGDTDLPRESATRNVNQLAKDGDIETLARDSQSFEQKLGAMQLNDDTSNTSSRPQPPDSRLVYADDEDTPTDTYHHDTTMHSEVKTAIIHETIRPIETTVINTERTVHRHVHHYVHRIQPVIVSSEEEEQHVHDIFGEGKERQSTETYREYIAPSTQDWVQGENNHSFNGTLDSGLDCVVCNGLRGKTMGKEGKAEQGNERMPGKTVRNERISGQDVGMERNLEQKVGNERMFGQNAGNESIPGPNVGGISQQNKVGNERLSDQNKAGRESISEHKMVGRERVSKQNTGK